MNSGDQVLVVVVKTRQDAQEEGTETHQELLFELEDVVLDELQEGRFDFEVGKLVEVVQVADEEAHVGAKDGSCLSDHDEGVGVRVDYLAV